MFKLIGIKSTLFLLAIVNLCSGLDVNVLCIGSGCVVEETISLRPGDKISFVTDGDPSVITSLIFWKTATGNNSNLHSIPREIFTTYTNLYELRFQGNIKTIATEDFLNAHKLNSLTLRNLIEKIPARVFVKASNIQFLNLQKNKISVIEDNAFEGLNKLKNLDLTENKITILKRLTFGVLPELSRLDLSNNEIETIEDGTLNLPKLSQLYLTKNKLKRLSNTVFSGAPLLDEIYLNKNEIEQIGKPFSGLNKLKIIDLDVNNIKYINLEDFAQLESLERLSLGNNYLEWINETSTGDYQPSNSKLNFLFLLHNKLSNKDILKRLSLFPRLETLFIGDNEFATLDYPDKPLKEVFSSLNYVNLGSKEKWEAKWLENFIARLKNQNIDAATLDYDALDRLIGAVDAVLKEQSQTAV